MRTPRGRVVTQFAYRHFGIKPSDSLTDMFSQQELTEENQEQNQAED